MALVIDATVTGSLLLPDDLLPMTRRLREAMRGERILVPWVWWFEVQNLLVANERRGRLGPDHTERILDAMRRLPVERDAAPEEGVTLALARRHGLSIYAAAYLELARRETASLATIDTKLADAAAAEDVPLLGQ